MKHLAIMAAMWGALTSLNVLHAKESEAEHRKEVIAQHKAIAEAHQAAAQCLEAGKSEKICHEALQKACKGLAIGKYCGMKHQH